MSPLFAAVRRAALLCLPFAAVLAAGVTLSTRVSADYPGGYPGGDPGHRWDVSSTQTGTWGYDLRDYPGAGQTTHISGAWPTGPVPGGYGVGGGQCINGNVQGTVTTTLKWIPAAGKTLQTDPAPNPLFVLEYGYA